MRNSFELPKRYSNANLNEVNNQSIDNLEYMSTLDIYHNMLNVLGIRMNKYQNSTITLTGCNSNFGSEKSNLELSEKRAETIKNYLTDVWKLIRKE